MTIQDPNLNPSSPDSQMHSADEYFAQLPFAVASAEPAPSLRDAHRAKGLFVVRESDKWNLEQFDAMRDQTYQNARHVPEVEAVRLLGMTPLTDEFIDVEVVAADGTTTIERIIVEEIREGDTRALLFCLGGYWHLWSRSSAHAEEQAGDDDYVNPFTVILIDAIRRVRPLTLHAATTSRLTRSISQGHKILGSLGRNVDVVCIKDQSFELTGEKGPMSLMFLNILFWAAAQERDAIVTRFATGKIAGWRQNRWPFGTSTVPFGHHLVDGKLVPDESQRDAVRQMMIVLSSDLPDGEVKTQLSNLGVTNARYSARGSRTPLGLQRNASTAVSSVFSWAPLWLQGEYLYRLGGSYPKSHELSGVPIVRRDREDYGELQMLYKIPAPEGGWAEPDLLRAFAEAAKARSRNIRDGLSMPRPLHTSIAEQSQDAELLAAILPSNYVAGADPEARSARMGSRAKRLISPLTGQSWRDDTHRYEVGVYPKGYHLYRRPLDAPAKVLGREVAYFAGDTMFKNLLPALAKALREGVPTKLLPGHSVFTSRHTQHIANVRESHIKAWSDTRDDARRRAATAHNLSLHPDISMKQRLAFVDDELRYLSRETEAQAEVDKLLHVQDKDTLDVDSFDVLTDVWLPAIRRLKDGTQVTQSEYQALRTIFSDFRLERNNGIWSGSVSVRVNTTVGVAVIGPVRWHIGHGGARGTQELTARHNTARHVTIGGDDRLRRQLTADGGVTDRAAGLLLSTPFAELPHVVLHGMNDVPFPEWVGPQWRLPNFVSSVTRTYAAPNFEWNKVYSEGSPVRQMSVDVALANGQVRGQDLLDRVPGLSRHLAAHLGAVQQSPGRLRKPSLRQVADGKNFATRTFEPLTCPHGHPASVVTRVPEVLADMLCQFGHPAIQPDAYGPDDVVFPDEYQLLRIPATEARAVAEDQIGKRNRTALGSTQHSMLCVLDALGQGSPNQINEYLVREGLRNAARPARGLANGLSNLQRLGLVTGTGQQPKVWRLTDDGRALLSAH